MENNAEAFFAEALHRDWKDTLDELLESTLRGVLFYDPDAERIFDLNPRAAEQTGYQEAELLEMKGSALFGEAGEALLRRIFARMRTSDHDLIWEHPLSLNHKNGDRGNYMCSLYSLPMTPGRNSPMALCMSLDSDSPAADAADLARKIALEGLKDHLWEYDIGTGVLTCSRRFRETLNRNGDSADRKWSAEEWSKAIHPDDAEEVFRSWRRFLTEGIRYRSQYRVRFNDGEWHWLLSFPHAVKSNADGTLEKAFGIHLDITDVMQKEKKLSNTEEQFNMIFENAGIGIAVADSDASLLKVNPAMAVMLGLNREDLEGRRLSTFAHPEDRAEIHVQLDRLLQGGRRTALPAKRFLRRDGETLLVNLIATLSNKARDGQRNIVLMLEDVTEQQTREEKLRYEATHDSMTGAWARWVLLEALTRHIGLANRLPQPLAFCMCDLDHFKQVNDRHGHQAGDRVLTEFVKRLKESVRDTDMIGRYGGEEFAVIFPNTTVAGASAAMERAGALLRETDFTNQFGISFRVTATFGIAGVPVGSTTASVIADADAALYEGKRQGRDRVVAHGL